MKKGKQTDGETLGHFSLLVPAKRCSCSEEFCIPSNTGRSIVLLHTDPRVRTITLKSTLEEYASVTWHILSLAQTDVTCELVSELRGEHATSSINWISYAKGTAKHTLTATNRFLARGGRGEIVMKGVAEETGTVKCSGMIEIGENGTGTETHLTQHVLMLDRTAKVDAIPGLEIRTNDVKASHSATVSRVKPEDLFYFQSRGIDERTARRMYVEGFLQGLLESIADRKIRQTCKDAMEEAADARCMD